MMALGSRWPLNLGGKPLLSSLTNVGKVLAARARRTPRNRHSLNPLTHFFTDTSALLVGEIPPLAVKYSALLNLWSWRDFHLFQLFHHRPIPNLIARPLQNRIPRLQRPDNRHQIPHLRALRHVDPFGFVSTHTNHKHALGGGHDA